MNNFYYEQTRTQILSIKGPDSEDFLSRLSTIDFKNWDEEQVRCGAFLTGKASAIALFLSWKERDCFKLLIQHEWSEEACWEYLQKMHFSENIILSREVMVAYVVLNEFGVRNLSSKELKKCEGLKEGWSFWLPDGVRVSEEEWRMLSAKNGIPTWGLDFKEDSILLEGPYESYLNRNKGCYPGQEVIEKIYTYKRLPKKIFKLKAKAIGAIKKITLPFQILVDGENIGTLTSLYNENGNLFGFATLKKNFSDHNKEIKILDMDWYVENV